MGYKTKIIDLKTLEELPTTMFSWIKKKMSTLDQMLHANLYYSLKKYEVTL